MTSDHYIAEFEQLLSKVVLKLSTPATTQVEADVVLSYRTILSLNDLL